MGRIRRRAAVFSFFDHTHIESFLADMSQRGLLLEKMGNHVWTFRRAERKGRCFTVSYAPNASIFDPEETEEQREFLDFCERTGWHLAASNAKLQVFYNEQTDPIPIQTDPALELERMHAAAMESLIPSHCLCLALAFIFGHTFVRFFLNNPSDPIGWLAGTVQMALPVFGAILFLLCAAELGGYILWRRRALRAAERGEFLKTPNSTRFRRILLWIAAGVYVCMLGSLAVFGESFELLVMLCWLGCFAVLLALLNGIRGLLRRKGVSRGKNRAVTLTVYLLLALALSSWMMYGMQRWVRSDSFTNRAAVREPPLTVGDLLPADESEYTQSCSGRESLLLAQYRAGSRSSSGAPGLGYVINDVKVPFLYEWCRDRLLRFPNIFLGAPEDLPDHQEYQAIPADAWGAREAYRLVREPDGATPVLYLLCYDRRIVVIRFDWEPTQEQQLTVRDRIGR